MRSEEEMMTLILSVAKQRSEVVAVGMNGSRVNPKAEKDIFQDFDIVYVVKDLESLLSDRSWINAFGRRLIMQTPDEMYLYPSRKGERFSFLMLFEDGNRIDLTLCPYSEVDHWLAEDQLIKILYDPHHFLPKIWPPTDQSYWIKQPTKEEFAECCNEFWWVSTYVVKGLYRKEFLYAQEHLFTHCQGELLRLLSWQVSEKKRYSVSVGKNYRYLPRYLSDEDNQRLLTLRALSSYSGMWENLIRTQDWFHQAAAEYAYIRGYFYDGKTAENIRSYTNDWYREEQKE